MVDGEAPSALTGLPKPDAVFVGGGLSDTLLDHLFQATCERNSSCGQRGHTRIVRPAHGMVRSKGRLTSEDRTVGRRGPWLQAGMESGLSDCPMAGGGVIVAGLGFRASATAESLADAFRRAGHHGSVTAVATAADKIGAEALRRFLKRPGSRSLRLTPPLSLANRRKRNLRPRSQRVEQEAWPRQQRWLAPEWGPSCLDPA